ncbi:MAG: DUF4097 domain-containing protein [Clostridia bacterium]|nr:DUF4097 domain-containing protein [Clostridia bacterium]
MKSVETFVLPGDVKKINFDVFSGEIEIKRSESFYIDAQEGDFALESKGAAVYVSREKKRLMASQKAKITVYVPDGPSPDVRVRARASNVDIDAGLYGTVTIDLDTGKVAVKDAVADVFVLKGSDVDAEFIGINAKASFTASVSGGDILMNGGFAARADLTIKGGNLGVWESDFESMDLSASKGNVQATLLGSEKDYSFKLAAKDGMVNRENSFGGQKTVKAYAAHGNVFMDFSYMKGKEKQKNDDDVAEDSGAQIRA